MRRRHYRDYNRNDKSFIWCLVISILICAVLGPVGLAAMIIWLLYKMIR